MGSSAGRQLFGIFGITASFAGVFLGGTLWWGAAAVIEEARESTTWPTTTGTITHADVERARLRGTWSRRTVYGVEADVRYAYVVDGVDHVGTNETLGPDRQWRHEDEGRRTIQRQYPVGREVTVWYRPTNPRLSVLQPGGSDDTGDMLRIGQGLTAAGSLGLVVVPVGWIVWGLVGRRR